MARWSAATLSIYSDTGLAAHVSEALGLVPRSAHEKGDRRVGKSREYAPYKSSGWHYEPDASKIEPDDTTGFAALRALVADIRHLSGALASLRPEYATIVRWSGEVSVQGNFVMEPELLADLGALGCQFYGTAYTEFDSDAEYDDSVDLRTRNRPG
ncbi:hypothetical protein BH09ACT5_BH09ACT5_10980 [soil metagenome]